MNFKNFSEAALLLLEFVAQEQVNGFHSGNFGAYCEHDNFDCKPWSTKTMQEVCESGVINVHPDSDNAFSHFDLSDDEMVSGVEFLYFDDDILAEVVAHFEIEKED